MVASLVCLSCFVLLLRYKLLIDSSGIVCTNFFGGVKRIAWTDIRRKILVVSRNRKQSPRTLRVSGLRMPCCCTSRWLFSAVPIANF